MQLLTAAVDACMRPVQGQAINNPLWVGIGSQGPPLTKELLQLLAGN